MFLTFYRFPCIHYISIFIKYSQGCTGKFHSSSNICLFHRDRCRFIFILRHKGNYFYILPLISCYYLNCLIRRYIACRSFLLPDIIFPERNIQSKDRFSVFPCHCLSKKRICLYDHFTLCLNIFFCVKTKLCAFYRNFCFRIFFFHGNFHLLAVIFKNCCLFHHRSFLIRISKSHDPWGFIQYKTFRSFGLHDFIGAKRQIL